MRRRNTAALRRSKGRAVACVHGAHQNPEVLYKTVAVQDPGAAMLAEHHPVDGPHGAGATNLS